MKKVCLRVSFYDQIGFGEVYDTNTLELMSDYFETLAQSKYDDVNNYVLFPRWNEDNIIDPVRIDDEYVDNRCICSHDKQIS